ncbi:MAG: TetR/AcrR family transcriptional regulator [Ignavibacteriaceae bacterium]|jgi:AcrR family transcriptional regulator|nr:TetR/AcrR family transcriptional regulator [Ignavibacteriaceae bacterium]
MQDKIIEQIEGKFFNDGFYKTTMDEVAAELGMSKKTIYKFFPSKDDLLYAIISHFMNGMKNKILPKLNSNKNAIEKLGDLLNILASATQKISPKRIEELKKYYPELWTEIDKFRTKVMFENMTKVIDQGKSEGLFLDYPTVIIMNVLVGALRYVVNPEFTVNNSFSISEAGQYTLRIVIGGILTEKGKKQFDKIFNKEIK